MARARSIFFTAKSVRRQPTFSPLDKSRRTFLGAFLTMVVLTSACAVFYIGTHVQAVNLGYKISQEIQRKEHLIEENKRLDLEIARLKSPTRIEEEAKEVFGLVLPKTQQVYYLSRWDEELNVRLAAAPEKTPAAKEPAKKPVVEEKAVAKATEKPVPAEKAAKLEKPTTVAAKPASAKPAAPTKAAKAAPAEAPKVLAAKTATEPPKTSAVKPATETSKTLAAKPTLPASKTVAAKPAPKVAAKAVPPPAAPSKVAKTPAADDPKNSDVEKTDLPAKPAAGKALAQNPAKPAKSPATKPSADTKLAKKETVLVARIVEKAPPAEKAAKPKAGPALAYQPKEKVPAVMLDPIP